MIYMLNMVIILIIMYSNVITAIDKIHTYLLCFNTYMKTTQQTNNFVLVWICTKKFKLQELIFVTDA